MNHTHRSTPVVNLSRSPKKMMNHLRFQGPREVGIPPVGSGGIPIVKALFSSWLRFPFAALPKSSKYQCEVRHMWCTSTSTRNSAWEDCKMDEVFMKKFSTTQSDQRFQRKPPAGAQTYQEDLRLNNYCRGKSVPGVFSQLNS